MAGRVGMRMFHYGPAVAKIKKIKIPTKIFHFCFESSGSETNALLMPRGRPVRFCDAHVGRDFGSDALRRPPPVCAASHVHCSAA